MSGDVMSFPSNWWTFVQQYQFADKEEIYTNGSMLIPSFRVRQMVEHYFGGEVGKTSRHAELFGTPERAARTLARMCAIGDGSCAGCPMFKANLEHCKSDHTHLKSIVEWLRGDAE